MAEHSQACVQFAKSIEHPNERELALAILDGKEDEAIIEEMGFDKLQIDAMRNRLISAGCDTVDEPSEEDSADQTADNSDENTDEDDTTSQTNDATDDAEEPELPELTEVPLKEEPEAPVQNGEVA